MADEDEKEYRWETGYEKTWEAITEDDSGLVEASVAEVVAKAKRRRLLQKPNNIRLGIMRHVFIIIDHSEAMADQDLKPTRHLCTITILQGFIHEFFDQNPISQIGLISTKNKRAEKISDMGGNPSQHNQILEKTKEMSCVGEPSLQNALEMAIQSLKHVPSHASREIIVILGSLTSCDPGNINTTIEALKTHNIRVSVVGLSAELRICKTLCEATSGNYNVVLDDSHFKEMVNQQADPPPSAANTESALIKMGFPFHHSVNEKDATPTMCMCHADSSSSKRADTGGYFCPQCLCKYCELPVECKACGLTLVSAPHLVRSYHHLFPLKNFNEVPLSSFDVKYCCACQKQFAEYQKMVSQCGKCSKIFCLDCDLFIHETLHVCPGCTSKVS